MNAMITINEMIRSYEGQARAAEIELKRKQQAQLDEAEQNARAVLPLLFASELGEKKSTDQLLTIISTFIEENFFLPRQLVRLVAYYVLLTWVYDGFDAVPYLRVMGERGTGKTELMRRVGHLCYRMMSAGASSSASSFFRVNETYRGTVFFDQADLAGGDMTNDLVKVLNTGVMRGSSIVRMEKTEMGETPGYEVVTYDTFGPKLIAMREDFKDDAVGSRCITIHLLPCDANELEGIKLYIDGEFREQAQAIRNLLLRWRLETWESEIRTGRDIEIMKGVSPRLAQVLLPIMAIAENDVVLRTQIDQYASEVRMRRALESRKPQDA